MLVFAQAADVESFTGQPAPENTERLIRKASGMVQHAIRRATFDTTPSGLPSDPDVADALRDAVCAQVEYWDGSDVDPTKADTTPALSSTGLDGSSLGFDTATAAQVKAQAADSLCDEAQLILDNAGLTRGPLWVS